MVTFYAVFHNATLLFLERLPFCLPFVWVLKIERQPFLLGYSWVLKNVSVGIKNSGLSSRMGRYNYE